MNEPKKIIVVCGPTATGKSDYAVTLAQQIDAEIISADSRQVYRGLDIGSGKITPSEMGGIAHHLLDVADPVHVFSAAEYQRLAFRAIDDIIARGKRVIICGGTGFYIDAVVYKTFFPSVPPNTVLRTTLADESVHSLAQRLEGLDPVRHASIDVHNKVRLIGAIEIATALGAVPVPDRTHAYEVEWHYLDFPDAVLKERIHTRLDARMKIGMIDEVRQLHADGLSWKRLDALGLEYRYIARYLQGKLTLETMLSELQSASWHYAKRQRTWFKKYAKHP